MFRLSQTSRNRKSAKSALRTVFKSRETFLNHFNFNEMQSKVTWDFTWVFTHEFLVKQNLAALKSYLTAWCKDSHCFTFWADNMITKERLNATLSLSHYSINFPWVIYWKDVKRSLEQLMSIHAYVDMYILTECRPLFVNTSVLSHLN